MQALQKLHSARGKLPREATASQGTSHRRHVLKLRRAYTYASEEETSVMIHPKQRLRLRKEMTEEKPTVWIGKNGITQGIIDDVSRKLKKDQIVKIRILRSGLKSGSCEKLAEEVSRLTKSTLIETRGHTIILFKKRNRKFILYI